MEILNKCKLRKVFSKMYLLTQMAIKIHLYFILNTFPVRSKGHLHKRRTITERKHFTLQLIVESGHLTHKIVISLF